MMYISHGVSWQSCYLRSTTSFFLPHYFFILISLNFSYLLSPFPRWSSVRTLRGMTRCRKMRESEIQRQNATLQNASAVISPYASVPPSHILLPFSLSLSQRIQHPFSPLGNNLDFFYPLKQHPRAWMCILSEEQSDQIRFRTSWRCLRFIALCSLFDFLV